MRKWAWLVIFALFIVATRVSAQGGTRLDAFHVQLLPEYDRPTMLVIYDFNLAEPANVSTNLTVRIPADATLFAVAYNEKASLINAVFSGPNVQGEWQVIDIVPNGQTAFHIEYYENLSTTDIKRQFTYLWPGDYAINSFNVFVGKPLDVTQMTTDPSLDEMQRQSDGLPGLGKDFGSLDQGKQFTLTLQYDKTSTTLVSPPNELQPASPVDQNTPGRISLNNYLPYILGGFGLVLILGGFLYYWQSGTRRGGAGPRRRQHARAVEQEAESEEQYCPQCGTRARPGDRFCRVCGSRLRQET